MNEPAQTGKRIVSKSEYAKALIERVGTRSIGWLCMTACGISILGVLWVGWTFAFFVLHEGITFSVVSLCVKLLGILALFIYFFGKWGINLLKEAKTMPLGVPLTRANTADLPAQDSLVRASEEPIQEQEAVLLRAVTQSEEKHEEQLLRTAKSRQEPQ